MSTSADSIRRIANDGIKELAVGGQHWRVHVLYPEVGQRQSVVLEVGGDVELLNFFKAFHLVARLPANTVPLDHPDVEIAAEDKGAKVLQRRGDAACTDERIVHEITRAYLTLISH